VTRFAWWTLVGLAVATARAASAQTPLPPSPPSDADAAVPATEPAPDEVAGVAVGANDAAVLEQLDAMLLAPTVRHPAGTARDRDTFVILATSLRERFVVIIDLRRARVYAFEPRAQRTVERAVPREVRGSPYAVAGIAFELLELLGLDTEPDPPPVVTQHVDTPPIVDHPPDPPIEPPVVAAPPVRGIDDVVFGLGARAVVGLTDEPRLFNLLGSIDILIAPSDSPRRLVIGGFAAGLGRESADSIQGSNSGSLSYRRTELGARVGVARRLRDHFALVGFVHGGLGLGAIGLETTGTGGTPPKAYAERWVSGFVGFGMDVRILIRGGFSFSASGSLDTLLTAHDYQGAAGSEFHESPIRFTFGLSLLWGTSSLGDARHEQQRDAHR